MDVEETEQHFGCNFITPAFMRDGPGNRRLDPPISYASESRTMAGLCQELHNFTSSLEAMKRGWKVYMLGCLILRRFYASANVSFKSHPPQVYVPACALVGGMVLNVYLTEARFGDIGPQVVRKIAQQIETLPNMENIATPIVTAEVLFNAQQSVCLELRLDLFRTYTIPFVPAITAAIAYKVCQHK
ncbi:hypothetical protein KIPB_012318 [Kipferlia bialata]|uniref:Uncharacterized protein n=1 Tax=Kipferlia bialata TaxID=797122 RepID=A0A9K3GNU0_9EUKA|nr:hypothetical protein KIPB_012318 [Kipferlia bialata]|eukprot:g12318.t1